MKIGIFDSGLGGLIITKAIIKKLPKHDYVYLGDTKNLPYGNKSQKQIFYFTTKALRYLFASDCKLAVIACNTSSAKALRKIQREFLPKNYPDRKVLGVIVPTVEAVGHARGPLNVGVLATISTAKSHVYKKELLKISPRAKIFEQAAPKLVELIEDNKLSDVKRVIKLYLKPLLTKKIGTLVLGCTHYPLLKKQIAAIVGKKIKVISQEDIIPQKLADYLKRHKEISDKLSKNGKRVFEVTKVNKGFKQVAKLLFGKAIDLKLVKY